MNRFFPKQNLIAVLKQYEKVIEEKVFSLVGFMQLGNTYDLTQNKNHEGKGLVLGEPYNFANVNFFEAPAGHVRFSYTVEYEVRIISHINPDQATSRKYVSVTPVTLYDVEHDTLSEFYIQNIIEVDHQNFDYVGTTLHE